MKEHAISAKGLWILLAAVVSAAGVWLYAERVLIPFQVADAAAQGRPRGNFSDIYPRWYGARELILHGRDPYSPELTREIQAGYYGRPLEPEQPGRPNYRQGFFYPVYVAFYLAPTIRLPFAIVQKGFFRGLLALTVISIPLWLVVVRWSTPVWLQACFVVFTLGSLPLVEGLLLEQITLVVFPMVAVAAALLTRDRQIPAGILLALATIKPQLVWLVLLWLVFWSVADWRRRYRWAGSFLMTMAILCISSEWYLPNWIYRFWRAVTEYRDYTGEMSVMQMLIGAPWSRGLELMAFAAMMMICWKERRQGAKTKAFAFTLSMVLAVTVLLVPSHGLYNQAGLVPALMMMLREGRTIWRKSRVDRALLGITILVLAWPWLSCVVLAGLSFILAAATVEKTWAVPFWTALLIPVTVAAAMLVYAAQRIFAASGEAPSS